MWFIPILKSLTWLNILIILVIQKLAPLIIFFHSNVSLTVTFLLSLLNTFVGSLIGVVQLQLKKILGYSSIHHLGWLILAKANS